MSIKINIPKGHLDIDKSTLKQIMRTAGKEIAREASNLIKQSQGTGITHGSHTASAPGQAPANKTGELASSFGVKVRRDGESVTVTDNAHYSLALEAGGEASKRKGGKDKNGRGVGNWKLEPRPFLTTAINNLKDTLGKRVSEAIIAGIKLKAEKKPRK